MILDNSTNAISYKVARITVPASGTYNYQQPYNFIRLLESTGANSDLMYRFGTSSTETEMYVGTGLKWPVTFPSVTIRNLTNAPINIVLATIQGDVTDDRLTVSGVVHTKPDPDTIATTSLETFDANGEIDCDSSAYYSVLIQNMSTTEPLYVFGNNTFKVDPLGTFEKNFAGVFKIYGTPGETASIGYFS